MRVAITRPIEYIEQSEEMLRKRGFDVIAAPMIGVAPRDDPGFEPFLRRVIEGVADFVIFTSLNGVRFTLEKIDEARRGTFISALNDPATNVVSMGPRTAEGLERFGIKPDMIPETFTSAGLLELLRPYVPGKDLEVVRSDHGSKILIDGLREAGGEVHEIKVYSIVRPAGERQHELIREVADGNVDILTFTSAQTVKNFFKTADELGLGNIIQRRLSEMLIAVIGEPTARVVEDLGLKVDIMPKRATFDDMIDEISKRSKV